ncbi:MAG: HisA/HisF-related TIM barrel protein [Pseudomonadota bacterium]
MILIPQIYLRNGKVVLVDRGASPLFSEDPLRTAAAIKDSGAEAIYMMDLSVPPVGVSPNLAVAKNIREETGLFLYVAGAFKSQAGIESFASIGADFMVLGSIAYQQPAFLAEVSGKFPGRIATHIEVKAGRVTIPGYAVVTNKTALDYAEQFLKSGVRHILYSDVGADGLMSDENLANIVAFCKQVTARIICATELSSLSDVERIVKLGALRLDGIVLGRVLQEGRIDLRSAISMVNDLNLASADESTLTEM